GMRHYPTKPDLEQVYLLVF
ncbi:EamA-like transporter family protein, partial [Haemophilus influenzae]